MDTELQDLLANNRAWAARTELREPGFFSRLLTQQVPKYMWIGCADSRVPANELIGLAPGEVFVHRNVANVVVHSDLNCLSTLQYAIDVLKVAHVIVVGHSGCGGVAAVMHDRRAGIVDNWLRHVQDVRNCYQAWLDGVAPERRVDALCELNVVEQATNVCRTTVVQDAWERGQGLCVHGWCYGLKDGLMQPLDMTASGPGEVAKAHDAAIAAVKRRYDSPEPRRP